MKLLLHRIKMDFSKRSYEKELLDRDDVPFEDIKRNMQELDFINRNLGGHDITLSGLRVIMKKITKDRREYAQPISVLEIGCGGGDNLLAIKKFFEKKKIPFQLTGVDINPHCIDFAKSRKGNAGIAFVHSDYRLYHPAVKPDIVFNSLFCHHFTNPEIVEAFTWMKENSAAGFFINDLHRHRLAYYSIKLLTKLFSKSYMVKNDAPLSVRRGFKRGELESINLQSSLLKYELTWKWAFRWLLIYTHE